MARLGAALHQRQFVTGQLALDNITLVDSPAALEPAVWTFMGGLGLVGFAACRRLRKA